MRPALPALPVPVSLQLNDDKHRKLEQILDTTQVDGRPAVRGNGCCKYFDLRAAAATHGAQAAPPGRVAGAGGVEAQEEAAPQPACYP